MPRAKANKLYRTFVKGLITEAGYLTYPEDSSSDELNTVLSRKGNRTRRRGIKFEDDYVLNHIGGQDPATAYQEFVWRSVSKKAGLSMVVVQAGNLVHFWAMDVSPLSDNKKSFTIDLLEYKAPEAAGTDVSFIPAQFASGGGYLFIAHKHCEPLVVEYNEKTDTIEVVRVVVQIRDFEGVYDGLANDDEPSSLSPEHHYNLMNQGWIAPGTTPTPALAAGEGGTGTQTYTDPYTGEDVEYTPGGGSSGGGSGPDGFSENEHIP